jgi:hypothetical protein
MNPMLYQFVVEIIDASGALKDSKVRLVPPVMQGGIIRFNTSSSEGVLHVRPDAPSVLERRDYPELCLIWDNDSDVVFDTL